MLWHPRHEAAPVMRQMRRSQRYTTCWSEILTIS
ncbi:DUF4113 domain-containing protein [Ktedonospora formicarum]